MTSAVIFDMDGTLVQTETLKAESYARAITQLRNGAVRHDDVIAAYDPLIGRSRSDVVRSLMEQFGLQDTDALVALRLRIYDEMISDRALLKRQEYPHSTALLRSVKQRGYPTALTTVSHAREAFIILDALDLRRYFDTIVTIDDVARAKPSPDLYLVAAARLGVQPAQCLAIEDSLAGVEAAVAAGIPCIAIANDLTRKSLHAQPPFPGEHIVDDPRELGEAAEALLGMKPSLSQPLGHA
jgi:beta-phosphoglucomutase